ncbi:MAG: membrane protein insertase YidC [Gammaproteobacteria bacterium]|nr:MAG: membrane protein insertase YidC [Gammaproteobacteria bacterium]
MESQRSLLFIALMVVTYLLFSQWQLDNAPAVQTPAQSTTIENVSSNSDYIPQASEHTTSPTDKIVTNATLIDIKTNVLELKVNTQGGDIVEAKLLKYDTELNNGVPFTLMQNRTYTYIAQSGLIGSNGIDQIIAGRPIYSTTATNFTFNDNQQELIVDLTYQDENALSVIKRLTFSKNGYSVKVDYIITNHTNNNANVQLYGQLKQTIDIPKKSNGMPTSAYRGAAYATDEDRYNKFKFNDFEDEKINISTKDGWVAMIQHYFVAAWIPKDSGENQLYSNYTQNGEAIIGFKEPPLTIAANSTANTSAIIYIGPKDQNKMAKIADGLDLTIDYGFLFMISQPLFWLLTHIFDIVGNWGIAIIVITLIVKGGMYPLTKVQYTSMARMRELQPKMAALKERFGDDRQKMSQATMALYKKEKVNPAGGCFPLLLQMPIFLALYWVFLESVELRHAPFFLWIQDLSAMDPYYVMPVLMGISMFVMQKMQPVTVQDPMQQKIMKYMPVVFSVFMAWFPSGLVLYWFISNLISITQMKIIFSGIAKKKALASAK